MPHSFAKPPGYRPSYQNAQLPQGPIPINGRNIERYSKTLGEVLLLSDPKSVDRFGGMLATLKRDAATWTDSPFEPSDFDLGTLQSRSCSSFGNSKSIIGLLLVIAGIVQSADASAVDFSGGAVLKYEFHSYPPVPDRIVMTVYIDNTDVREFQSRAHPGGQNVCNITGNPRRSHPSHDTFHSTADSFVKRHVHLETTPSGARCLHDRLKDPDSSGRVFTQSNAKRDAEVIRLTQEFEHSAPLPSADSSAV